MGLRMIIIEDNLLTREMIKDMLDILGHKVVAEAEDLAHGWKRNAEVWWAAAEKFKAERDNALAQVERLRLHDIFPAEHQQLARQAGGAFGRAMHGQRGVLHLR